MNKKEIFLLTLLAFITLTLGAGALFEYQHQQIERDQAVVSARQERDDAKLTLAQKTKAYNLNLQSAQTQVTSLTNQKTALCTQIKTAKLTNSLCL